jgi:uncharacterized protein (TIGR03086 family)
MEPPAADLHDALDEAGRLVAGVQLHQWALGTPCEGWSVRNVVQHLVEGNRNLARAFGSDVREQEDDANRPDDGWSDAFAEAARALAATVADPEVLGRTVTVPFGTVPGVVAVQLRLVDQLVHGWDVARATGQVPAFDDAAVGRALAFTERTLSQVPAERSPFGPPVPPAADAPPLDRLAALLGHA